MATRLIRAIQKGGYDLVITKRAQLRLRDLSLVMGDCDHVFRAGVVKRDGVPSSREGYYRYLVEARTPNFITQALGLVVIPEAHGQAERLVSDSMIMPIDDELEADMSSSEADGTLPAIKVLAVLLPEEFDEFDQARQQWKDQGDGQGTEGRTV